MTTTHDIETLCAAIDAGDDSALMPLADALEEAGDPRASGVRLVGVGDRPIAPNMHPSGWMWAFVRRRSYAGRNPSPHQIIVRPPMKRGWSRIYPTRSAAFLALAEALTQEGY